MDEVLEGDPGGDPATALVSFDRLLALYRAEAQQFRERGLPYREGGFLTELYSERASILSSMGVGQLGAVAP